MEIHQIHQIHQVHLSQRRVSCEFCRNNKAKCQRVQPEDLKCLRCTLNNLVCDAGQQRKVGRPKRKESASSSAPNTKRRKQSGHIHPASTDNTNRRDTQLQSFARTLPRTSDAYGASTRISTVEHMPSRPHAGVKSLASASVPRTPDSEWLGFPTFMTDRWRRQNIPGAAGGGIVTNAEFGSLPDENATGPAVPPTKASPSGNACDITPAMLSIANHALFGGSLAWINPEPRTDPPLSSMYDITRKKLP
jgi:hypothetical protein